MFTGCNSKRVVFVTSSIRGTGSGKGVVPDEVTAEVVVGSSCSIFIVCMTVPIAVLESTTISAYA